MPQRHWISELAQHTGVPVEVHGWVQTTRSSGKIAFVVIRDGTGSIQGVVSTVAGVLASTTWMGPARELFQQDWDGSFTAALHRLNEAFGAAGRDCLQRSSALRQVMGA